MVFNIQKFLVKNRLTKRSRLNEDAETKTDAEKVAMGAEEGDDEMFDQGTEIDAQDKPETPPSSIKTTKQPRTSKGKQLGLGMSVSGIDINPDAGITPSNKPVRDLQSKQTKLKDLENKKDALL